MWIDKDKVIQWAGTKITVPTAEKFFEYYSETIYYIEKNDEGKRRLSDSAKIYYEYLKKETDKYNLDVKSVRASINNSQISVKSAQANIKTARWTRANIGIGLLISATTLSVLLFTCRRDTNRYNKELEKQSKDTPTLKEINKSVLELKSELHQISLSLKDTSKVKVKIVK